MEKNPGDYNEVVMEEVKVEIKQVEALVKELEGSINISTDVFMSLHDQVSIRKWSPMVAGSPSPG